MSFFIDQIGLFVWLVGFLCTYFSITIHKQAILRHYRGSKLRLKIIWLSEYFLGKEIIPHMVAFGLSKYPHVRTVFKDAKKLNHL